jgi:hypothetical protein
VVRNVPGFPILKFFDTRTREIFDNFHRPR